MFKEKQIFAAPLAGSRLRGNDKGNESARVPIFAAPLAGITDKPFRKIMRRLAPDAAMVTEMISCHSLAGGRRNCLRNLDDYSDEGNIGAQIFGANPELMANAAKILQDRGAKWIDINMGCPVPKVATRAGAGAFLMRDHALAGRIVKSVVNSVSIPVSVKTRLGWDDSHRDWTDLVRIAGDNGAAFAALHGRTRAQGYAGHAELPKIEGLMPMIANGDIKTKEDIARAEALGYSGAMIGRALLGRPWLLGELSGQESEIIKNKSEIILEHLELVVEYYGERAGVPLFRKHAAWYSSGMKNSAEFRIKVNHIADARALKSAICEFWGCESNSQALSL
ncbi:MAG: tRNA-dihydrouridine synthase [Rickettsiales bacterium]|jgi:tRNA-dihydrouridine synthase B|nr:tRNA-dihydrouridine synthase [Rickettsiales bacterium]